MVDFSENALELRSQVFLVLFFSSGFLWVAGEVGVEVEEPLDGFEHEDEALLFVEVARLINIILIPNSFNAILEYLVTIRHALLL